MELGKVLIIQTAFIGDVVLATPIIEKLKKFHPDSKIDFLLRKGNENLLQGHPLIRQLLIWDKRNGKMRDAWRLIKLMRQEKYDLLINLQRFGSTGFMTFLSGARYKVGFEKNPFAFSFHKKVSHEIGNGKHEVERNLSLISEWTDEVMEKPKLYLPAEALEKVSKTSSQSSPVDCTKLALYTKSIGCAIVSTFRS